MYRYVTIVSLVQFVPIDGREKRAAQRVSDSEEYKLMTENQRFDRLQKALPYPEATLELLVPEGRKAQQ